MTIGVPRRVDTSAAIAFYIDIILKQLRHDVRKRWQKVNEDPYELLDALEEPKVDQDGSGRSLGESLDEGAFELSDDGGLGTGWGTSAFSQRPASGSRKLFHESLEEL